MNQNWPRWIKASIAKHFNSAATSDLPLFIEGTDRPSIPPAAFAELRIDGPFIKQVNPHYWVLNVDINVLLQVTFNDQDIYNTERAVGQMLKAFTLDIAMFKLGLGDLDDQSQFGCLVNRTDNKENVAVTNFGQRGPENRLMMSAITAGYRMDLDDEN